MAPCKQVAFEPSLAKMLAEHFHDATIRAQFFVDGYNLGHRATFCCLEDGVQSIGVRFIGAEHAKVFRIHFEDIAEEIAKFARRLGQNLTRAGDLKRIVGEIWQRERN